MARKDIERTTPEEDADVHADALRDPDNPPLTDEQLGQFRRMEDARPDLLRRFRGQRGPQRSKPLKVRATLRLDPDVVARFRRQGRGWQSRVNATLRKVLKPPKVAGKR